jgi:hypothetical protein
MNDVRTQVRDAGRRRLRAFPARLIDVTVAAVFAIAVTSFVLHDPRRTPDVTIENDTPYDLTIGVSDATGLRRMGFALVNAQSKFTAHAPIDQGAVWTFSFGPGGEYRVDRSALRDAGWRIRVPASVPDRFAAAGIAPAPKRT